MSKENNNLPLVTVALAVYNNAAFIDECLNCIERQTYPNLEILCVDDCSQDESVAILNRHASADSRFRIITKDQNAGLSDTRNISMQEARGEYIYFCDADDVCEPEMIEKAVKKAEAEKADMVLWDFYEFGDSIYKLMKKDDPSRFHDGMSNKEMLHAGAFMWTHLFRTASLKALGIQFPIGRTKQDLPVHWAACICFDKIAIIPERLYGYRIGQQQISRKKGKVLFDFIYVHDYLKDYLMRREYYEEYKMDFLLSQTIAMYTAAMSVSPQYKAEAYALAKNHFVPEMIEATKDAHVALRWFVSSLNGDIVSKLLLQAHNFIYKIYRKLIV